MVCAARTAETLNPTGKTGAGATPPGSRTCGTFPRPAASPSPAHRHPPRRTNCGTRCAGWPGGSAMRSSMSRARQRTASPGGPPAASASRPGLNAPQARWALTHQLGHVLLHGPGSYPTGETASGDYCLGVVKAEADAVSYIVGARQDAGPTGSLASPQAWAGTDPRAQPGAIILTAGQRIAAAAAQITYVYPLLVAALSVSGLI